MTTVAGPVGLDEGRLVEFVFRAVDEVNATLNGAGGDGRQARPLPRARRRRPAHPRPAGRAHRHDGALRARACERFFRPGYNAHLLDSWLPALDGVQTKLEQGARVADVGCGHGASTILMAQAFPNSSFLGSDYHHGSITTARTRAHHAGIGDRVRFETAPANAYSGHDYDLVTMFDCLHDIGDPLAAARHVHHTLAPNGTWMIVEPAAGDHLEDNLTPIGRAYYGLSTLLCTPASLAQETGLALGAQAGETRIRTIVQQAGYTHFRRTAQTPLNHVYEARR